MSTKFTINVSDVVDFGKEIQDEASQLSKNLHQAMRASALEVQTTAKRPGYAPYKTGTLRRSITHKIKTGAKSISAIIGSNLVYAAIHEFGGRAGRGGSVQIKAKRYIQRSIEDNTDGIKARITKALTAGIIK